MDSGCLELIILQLPKPRILDSTRKFSQILDFISKNFPDSGIRLPFIHGVIFIFSVAPDFIHFLLIADGMEEQYSSIPPFNASAATPADVYKLDDSILVKFQIMYKMFVTVISTLFVSYREH